MRKLIIVAVLLLMCASVYGEDFAYMYTDGYRNGRFITSEQTPLSSKINFISGVLDGIAKMRGDVLPSLYPNCIKGDIINAVIKYYEDNPTQRNRPVVDVILSGCK